MAICVEGHFTFSVEKTIITSAGNHDLRKLAN